MNLATIIGIFLKQENAWNSLNEFQQKVLQDIIDCRTPILGGHIMACPDCGCVKATYNSCRNRHCPQCGGYKRDKWTWNRKQEAIPVKYFHMVFTVPHEFNPLFVAYPAIMDTLLFKCAWETLSQFGNDHKYLGAQMGMLAILHTWGQNLSLHPHIHCLVPGGGLTKQGKWRNMKKSNGKFLFPVKALSLVFKAKFCASVAKLYKSGKINPPKGVDNFYHWNNSIYNKNWVVYAKKPVPKGTDVVEYLSRYTHKVAISNSRIKSVENDMVTFSYLDYRTSKIHDTQLHINEFVRRFLLHILPKGFVKIRYYGFMSCRNKAKTLQLIDLQLGKMPAENVKGLP